MTLLGKFLLPRSQDGGNMLAAASICISAGLIDCKASETGSTENVEVYTVSALCWRVILFRGFANSLLVDNIRTLPRLPRSLLLNDCSVIAFCMVFAIAQVP